MEKFGISQGNCTLALNRFVNIYAPHAALSLLKLKIEFYGSNSDSIEKDPNEWILTLEGLQRWMMEFGLKGSIIDGDLRSTTKIIYPKSMT